MTHPVTRQIRSTLRQAKPRTVPAWRNLRREWSRELKSRPAEEIVKVGLELLDEVPWGRLTAYELIASHPSGIGALDAETVERLANGLADWASVDVFACYVAGPAWREGQIPTRQIHAWVRSADRWRRRTAVVCTVPLNLRSRGGRGDAARTLEVCRRVVADRDDMVVKALSWALRELVRWDRAAVEEFLDTHDAELAARVKREVRTKLTTGRKNVKKPRQHQSSSALRSGGSTPSR